MTNNKSPYDLSYFYPSLVESGFLEKILTAHEATMQQVYDSIRGSVSQLISLYHIRNVFIRCPACGRDYCISDQESGVSNELYDRYQRRKGKDYKIQCDQIYSTEVTEDIREFVGESRPICNHIFTLHEGIIEYKAQTAVEWFARGPYTVVEEGSQNIVVGQSIRPDLKVGFSWIDYVILNSDQTRSGFVNIHWRRVGRKGNQFEIFTSTEDKDNLGKPIKIDWQAVGLKILLDDEKEQIETEYWRGHLISAARKLLYEYDPKTSILESETAFELFLEKFIEDNWTSPHMKENREYLQKVAGFSTETNARILLHEALGIHYVKSEVWKDWLWAKTFRNQIAHGKPLLETKYTNKTIGNKFKDSSDIAKFCYRSIVRAIYFIRYWNE